MAEAILTTDPENSIVDMTDPVDKEVVSHHPIAGASSEAPASSGIPSAMTQQAIRAEGNADRKIAARQNAES